MEKWKPHHELAAFQRACANPDSLPITEAALRGAAALLFDRFEIVEVLKSVRREHFYKSMTAHRNSRQWQDVYHVPWYGMTLYVKFTDNALTAFTLLSFKEK